MQEVYYIKNLPYDPFYVVLSDEKQEQHVVNHSLVIVIMKNEIRYRLNGLESIVHHLHHNAELLKYLSVNLHRKTFNLFNNPGLYWVWGQTMGNQILNLYKVVVKDEKFSFIKILNIAKELKCKVNYVLLEKKISLLKDKYDKTNFETVRSKYVAHQDLRVPEMETNLFSIISLTDQTIELFLLFSKEFKGRKVKLTNFIVESVDKIFNTVDEYERVQGFLIAEQIKGNRTVKISRIATVINEYQRVIRNKERKRKASG